MVLWPFVRPCKNDACICERFRACRFLTTVSFKDFGDEPHEAPNEKAPLAIACGRQALNRQSHFTRSGASDTGAEAFPACGGVMHVVQKRGGSLVRSGFVALRGADFRWFVSANLILGTSMMKLPIGITIQARFLRYLRRDRVWRGGAIPWHAPHAMGLGARVRGSRSRRNRA